MAASQSQRPNQNRARLAMLATSCRRQQPLTFSNQADYLSCENRPGLSLTSRRAASPPCLVSPMRREEILRHCSPPSLRSVRHLSWFIQKRRSGIFLNYIFGHNIQDDFFSSGFEAGQLDHHQLDQFSAKPSRIWQGLAFSSQLIWDWFWHLCLVQLKTAVLSGDVSSLQAALKEQTGLDDSTITSTTNSIKEGLTWD